MGGSSSKVEPTVDQVASSTKKVLKAVDGDSLNKAAKDVKTSVHKASDKTSSAIGKAASNVDKAVTKAGKDVSKAISNLLDEPEEEKLDQLYVAVPLVAVLVLVGAYLWKKKPWKKSDAKK